MVSLLGIRFWGTRGLVSTPGKENVKYGGNTSCAQILHDANLVVVDAGFGITNLGEQMLSAQTEGSIHIFFTHMHWDHIQGLPFFHPIYFPETKLHLYSPLPAKELKASLDILFDGSYSPFQGIDSMPADISFHQVKDKLHLEDGLEITSIQVNHGCEHNQHGKTFGYRFQCQDHGIAFITDHEARPKERNQPVVEFCKNVDLLVHDAQYTEDEYTAHVGWGHSTPRMAVENAKACETGELLMTHHDPSRTDFQLDVMARRYRTETIKIDFAKENNDYWVEKHLKKKDVS